MPYKLQKEGDGYVVVNSETGKRHSKKPIPRSRAVAQMRLLYGVENGTVKEAVDAGAKLLAAGIAKSDIQGIWYDPDTDRYFVSVGDWVESPTLQTIRKILGQDTEIEAESSPPSRYTVSLKAANYGAHAGQTIIGRLVRGANGRFGSGDASSVQADANATIAQNRAANAAAPKAGGRKRRAGALRAKPRKGRTKKPRAARAKKPRAQSKVQAKRQQEREAVFNAMKDNGLNRAAFDAITALSDGKPGDNDMLSALAGETGLAELTADGSYQLTPAGRSYVRAANRGNVEQAKRALVKGQRAVEDAATTKEADPVIPAPLVFKDASGRLRWVTFSSTAYRDRDDEIVSTKALADDVARADTDGDYGPLRWWHTPGVELGDCDFNAVTASGRVLVESGTFRDERIGERIKAAAPKLQVSIGFSHAPTELVDGVFHHIRRLERSLLPAGRASNPYTRLLVQETPSMDQPKQDALKALLGDDELLAQLLTQADQTTKAADAAGVAFKEAEAEAAPVTDDGADDGDIAVGDMSPDEYVGLHRRANQPLVDALGAFASAINGQTTKAAGIETRLSAVEATATKAVEAAAPVPDLATQLATAQTALKAAQAEIATLKGDLPKSLKERQASRSETTVMPGVTEESVKSMQPGGDPGFMGFVFGAPAQQGA